MAESVPLLVNSNVSVDDPVFLAMPIPPERIVPEFMIVLTVIALTPLR